MKHQVRISKASFQGGERSNSLSHDARWMGQTVPVSKFAGTLRMTTTIVTMRYQSNRRGTGRRESSERLSGPCHPALRNKLPERPRGANWAQRAGGPGQQERAPRPGGPLDRRRRPGSSPTCHRAHPCDRKARPAASESAHLREQGQSPHLYAGPTGWATPVKGEAGPRSARGPGAALLSPQASPPPFRARATLQAGGAATGTTHGPGFHCRSSAPALGPPRRAKLLPK